jgi:hypothetical protein
MAARGRGHHQKGDTMTHHDSMTRPDAREAPRPAVRRVTGLRASAFGAVIMLLAEYCLGVWVNLYAQLPASDHGTGLLTTFGRAVANGPVTLALHALLGTLLVVTAIGVIIHAARARDTASTVIAVIAFLAVAGAWVSGSRFVGGQSSSASFGMAAATAIALLGYVTILFLPPRRAE